MERAIALAAEAALRAEVPVGAVVYKGDRIIAEASNNREAAQDPVGHAELLAMSKAGKALGNWRLTDCTLAVTLEPGIVPAYRPPIPVLEEGSTSIVVSDNALSPAFR